MMGRFSRNLTMFSLSRDDNDFVIQQFDYSTADIEASIFFGDSSSEALPEMQELKGLKGIFRIVDGKLNEIIDLAPPNAAPIQKSSGLFKLAGF